jgi:hypothetical protein
VNDLDPVHAAWVAADAARAGEFRVVGQFEIRVLARVRQGCAQPRQALSLAATDRPKRPRDANQLAVHRGRGDGDAATCRASRKTRPRKLWARRAARLIGSMTENAAASAQGRRQAVGKG